MKKQLISLIELYQKTPLQCHFRCKYIPTCSNYAKEALLHHGIIGGSFLTVKRILRCTPFHKGGIDPVPMKEKK